MTRTLVVLRPPFKTPDRLALSSNGSSRPLLGYGTTDFMWHAAGAGASALDDLTDVVISSASNSEVLRYNGSNWVDASLVLDDLSDVLITSAPSNLSSLYYDQAGSTWRDSMRIWRPIMASSSNLLIDGATNEVIMGYSA